MTTKTKTKARAAQVDEALEAQLAFEQELLVGAAIDLLNALVNESGVSQRELARRLGVTEGRVSQILSGSQNISLKKLAEVGWALGIRFEVVPSVTDDRRSTPAAEDPDAPEWVRQLQLRIGPRAHRGGEARAEDAH